MNLGRFYLLISVVLGILIQANAQQGSINGIIIDSEMEAIAGCNIKIQSPNKFTQSDFEGKFSFTNIQEGDYEIVFQLIGYERKNIKIHIKKAENKSLTIILQNSGKILQEIVIKDTINKSETDFFVRKWETNSPQILNSISARSIQLSPDLTVANVLQRISAVSIDRNSQGDGQYAIIRGMDKRYNYTLVNGIKIPSPDSKNRYVPMDVFPSELLERLDVIKALLPSMEADAIGGAINMIMKNAPQQFSLTIHGAIGYSTIFQQRPYTGFDHSVIKQTEFINSPAERMGSNYQAKVTDFIRTPLNYSTIDMPINYQIGISIGKRFWKNKLGLIAALSQQNFYRGTQTTVLLPSAQPYFANSRNENMILHFEDINYREYSVQQSRYGIHTQIDYRINKRHSLNLYGMYVELNEFQSRYTIDTNTKAQRSGPGTGEVHLFNRSKYSVNSIYNSTLKGEHKITNQLNIAWILAYSLAQNQTPAWYDFERVYGVSLDSNKHSQALPAQVSKMNIRWLHNSDIDKSSYLNLNYKSGLKSLEMEWSIGGMFRNKTRSNYYNVYELTPTADKNGNYPQYYTNINDALFTLLGINAGLGTPKDPNNYSITENISAAYLQFKFDYLSKWQCIGGIRYERTNQDYVTAADPNQMIGAKGNKSYGDYLPSIHLKYLFNKKMNMRASYYASISRPGFFEIIPYSIPGENFTEEGNIHLKHTTADNYDLRWEWFPKSQEQLLVGLFYKKIINPIEVGFYREPGNPTGVYLAPQNFGSATNYGFEISFIKYFGVFGLNLNYTYTNSQISSMKAIYFRDQNGNLTTDSISQTRPLQGQSAHIGNISLLYKNPKSGLQMQLALVYTGKRIAQLSAYYNLDVWQREFIQMDISAEKRLKQKLFIYLKINNILNSPLITEIFQNNIYRNGVYQLPIQDNSNSVVTQKEIYYQTILLGIKFKLE